MEEQSAKRRNFEIRMSSPDGSGTQVKVGEIRCDEQDELDEVVLEGHAVRFVHLERMNLGGWWLGLDLADGRTVHVRLNARRPELTVVRGMAEVE